MECPPTPPYLPTGEDAKTPPPKGATPPPKEGVKKKRNGEKRKKRTSSPDPNCAICLGNLENMSYTDSCFHKFCFTCLLEWSKVKPECPLCKAKFRSIIHNIRNDDDYDSYQLPPPPPPEPDRMIDILQEMRRFGYHTTVTAERMERRRYQLLALQNDHYTLPRGLPNRVNTGILWRRRRGPATSDFRRDVYSRNLWVDRVSVSDVTGRYRECSPEWYRNNPAQTHRLVPWLNRELNVLLEHTPHQSTYVLQAILELIQRFDIRSPEFHEQLLPYFGTRTDHFQHEFYAYASSVYDMVGYDRAANYSERPAAQYNTTVISSEEDDIIVVDEVRPTADTLGDRVRRRLADRDLLLHDTDPMLASEPLLNNVDAPSTSSGEASNSLPRLVIPPDDSDDDTDGLAVVEVIKPRHLRTPVVVNISSGEQTAIELSSDEAVPPAVAPTVSNKKSRRERRKDVETRRKQRFSTSSDEEEAGPPVVRPKKDKGKGKGKKSSNVGKKKKRHSESEEAERPDLVKHREKKKKKKKKKRNRIVVSSESGSEFESDGGLQERLVSEDEEPLSERRKRRNDQSGHPDVKRKKSKKEEEDLRVTLQRKRQSEMEEQFKNQFCVEEFPRQDATTADAPVEENDTEDEEEYQVGSKVVKVTNDKKRPRKNRPRRISPMET